MTSSVSQSIFGNARFEACRSGVDFRLKVNPGTVVKLFSPSGYDVAESK